MFNRALAANPVIIEMAEEISARGVAIEKLQQEIAGLRAETQRLQAALEAKPEEGG